MKFVRVVLLLVITLGFAVVSLNASSSCSALKEKYLKCYDIKTKKSKNECKKEKFLYLKCQKNNKKKKYKNKSKKEKFLYLKCKSNNKTIEYKGKNLLYLKCKNNDKRKKYKQIPTKQKSKKKIVEEEIEEEVTHEMAEEEEVVEEEVKDTIDRGVGNYFLRAAVGIHNLTIDTQLDDSEVKDVDDGFGTTIDFGVGYIFTSNITGTINYAESSFGIGKITNTYLAANYWLRRGLKSYKLGGLVAQSVLTFDDDTIVLEDGETEHTSTVFGAVAGFDYRLNNRLSWGVDLQIIPSNKKFLIGIYEKELNYDIQTNILFGIKYQL